MWDSGACKCVISLESHKTIPGKYKTESFPSNIKIKAANGSIIHNIGECDITFRMGSEKFTFPFLCSDQLSQSVIVGHNFCNTFNIGTVWTTPDIMSLTYEGRPIAQCARTKGINALVFCTETLSFHHFQMPRSNAKLLSLNSIQILPQASFLNPLLGTDLTMLTAIHMKA